MGKCVTAYLERCLLLNGRAGATGLADENAACIRFAIKTVHIQHERQFAEYASAIAA